MNDPGDAMKAVWRSQPVEVPTMSMSYVQHRNNELQRALRIRNFLEQGTSVLALLGCGFVIIVAPYVWVKAAVGLLGIGILCALVQWRRRAAPHRTGCLDTIEAGIVFYRRQLERKRDMHRTLWRWYLLPMVPGCIAILAWNFFGDPATKGTATPWLVAALFLAWMLFAVLYERAKAAQCQREIDALSEYSGAGTDL